MELRRNERDPPDSSLGRASTETDPHGMDPLDRDHGTTPGAGVARVQSAVNRVLVGVRVAFHEPDGRMTKWEGLKRELVEYMSRSGISWGDLRMWYVSAIRDRYSRATSGIQGCRGSASSVDLSLKIRLVGELLAPDPDGE